MAGPPSSAAGNIVSGVLAPVLAEHVVASANSEGYPLLVRVRRATVLALARGAAIEAARAGVHRRNQHETGRQRRVPHLVAITEM
jgi:hypothetical protein